MPNMMYHFVGCDENLKGISLEDFRAQLDGLQNNFAPDDVVLTFDHGTIDHIEIVAPELERRGLRGVFFILTMVPEERRVAAIDKQRFLEGDLRHELARMLCKELFIDYQPEVAETYLAEFSFYSLEERYLRYLRDTMIPAPVFESVMDSLFTNVFGDEKAFCIERYLSWHHIYQLHKRGHVIGSHSHYHNGDAEDYAKSLRFIGNVIGEVPMTISYPNGNKYVSDEDLEKIGVKTAYLSREEGGEPFYLPRADCNQFELT